MDKRSRPESVQHEGVPRFSFQRRRERVDWRAFASVNVDQVMRELDVACLQRNLTNITFCDIESEDLSQTDPNFIKLFRLAQLMLEYVLHSQDYLAREKELLESRVQALSLEAQELAVQCEQLKKENAKRRRTVEHFQSLLETNHIDSFVCNFCGKTFLNGQYLLAHQERRHPDHRPFNIPSQATRPKGADGDKDKDKDRERQKNEELSQLVQRLQDELQHTKHSLATEIEKKSRELEQQRRQDDADRALADMQKRREVEASHRDEIRRREEAAADLRRQQEERYKQQMEELRETLMREMRQLQQESRESKAELERVRKSNLGAMVDDGDLRASHDGLRAVETKRELQRQLAAQEERHASALAEMESRVRADIQQQQLQQQQQQQQQLQQHQQQLNQQQQALANQQLKVSSDDTSRRVGDRERMLEEQLRQQAAQLEQAQRDAMAQQQALREQMRQQMMREAELQAAARMSATAPPPVNTMVSASRELVLPAMMQPDPSQGGLFNNPSASTSFGSNSNAANNNIFNPYPTSSNGGNNSGMAPSTVTVVSARPPIPPPPTINVVPSTPLDSASNGPSAPLSPPAPYTHSALPLLQVPAPPNSSAVAAAAAAAALRQGQGYTPIPNRPNMFSKFEHNELAMRKAREDMMKDLNTYLINLHLNPASTGMSDAMADFCNTHAARTRETAEAQHPGFMALRQEGAMKVEEMVQARAAALASLPPPPPRVRSRVTDPPLGRVDRRAVALATFADPYGGGAAAGVAPGAGMSGGGGAQHMPPTMYASTPLVGTGASGHNNNNNTMGMGMGMAAAPVPTGGSFLVAPAAPAGYGSSASGGFGASNQPHQNAYGSSSFGGAGSSSSSFPQQSSAALLPYNSSASGFGGNPLAAAAAPTAGMGGQMSMYAPNSFGQSTTGNPAVSAAPMVSNQPAMSASGMTSNQPTGSSFASSSLMAAALRAAPGPALTQSSLPPSSTANSSASAVSANGASSTGLSAQPAASTAVVPTPVPRPIVSPGSNRQSGVSEWDEGSSVSAVSVSDDETPARNSAGAKTRAPLPAPRSMPAANARQPQPATMVEDFDSGSDLDLSETSASASLTNTARSATGRPPARGKATNDDDLDQLLATIPSMPTNAAVGSRRN